MEKSTDVGSESTEELSLQDQRRAVVQRCMKTLMSTDPQFYYQPSSEVAREIHAALQHKDALDEQERRAVKSMSVKDIELLLAFK